MEIDSEFILETETKDFLGNKFFKKIIRLQRMQLLFSLTLSNVLATSPGCFSHGKKAFLLSVYLIASRKEREK
jgi:hypothetical protein